jgi:hypothetical protein
MHVRLLAAISGGLHVSCNGHLWVMRANVMPDASGVHVAVGEGDGGRGDDGVALHVVLIGNVRLTCGRDHGHLMLRRRHGRGAWRPVLWLDHHHVHSGDGVSVRVHGRKCGIQVFELLWRLLLSGLHGVRSFSIFRRRFICCC